MCVAVCVAVCVAATSRAGATQPILLVKKLLGFRIYIYIVGLLAINNPQDFGGFLPPRYLEYIYILLDC